MEKEARKPQTEEVEEGIVLAPPAPSGYGEYPKK